MGKQWLFVVVLEKNNGLTKWLESSPSPVLESNLHLQDLRFAHGSDLQTATTLCCSKKGGKHPSWVWHWKGIQYTTYRSTMPNTIPLVLHNDLSSRLFCSNMAEYMICCVIFEQLAGTKRQHVSSREASDRPDLSRVHVMNPNETKRVQNVNGFITSLSFLRAPSCEYLWLPTERQRTSI